MKYWWKGKGSHFNNQRQYLALSYSNTTPIYLSIKVQIINNMSVYDFVTFNNTLPCALCMLGFLKPRQHWLHLEFEWLSEAGQYVAVVDTLISWPGKDELAYLLFSKGFTLALTLAHPQHEYMPSIDLLWLYNWKRHEGLYKWDNDL